MRLPRQTATFDLVPIGDHLLHNTNGNLRRDL